MSIAIPKNEYAQNLVFRPFQNRFRDIPQCTLSYATGKDVVKSIADRAAWRDDERRWCREGKLPKPIWWE